MGGIVLTLTLYTTDSPVNAVDKSLTQIGAVKSIDIYDSVSIVNPVFVINSDNRLLSCNYLYCTELGRYYHVTVSLDSAKRLVLSCGVDVLMSWEGDIRSASATVVRSESVGKPTYVVDSQLPIVQGSYQVTAQIFPSSPVNTDSATPIVLVTLGSVS